MPLRCQITFCARDSATDSASGWGICTHHLRELRMSQNIHPDWSIHLVETYTSRSRAKRSSWRQPGVSKRWRHEDDVRNDPWSLPNVTISIHRRWHWNILKHIANRLRSPQEPKKTVLDLFMPSVGMQFCPLEHWAEVLPAFLEGSPRGANCWNFEMSPLLFPLLTSTYYLSVMHQNGNTNHSKSFNSSRSTMVNPKWRYFPTCWPPYVWNHNPRAATSATLG